MREVHYGYRWHINCSQVLFWAQEEKYMTGKAVRLTRIFNPLSRRTVIAPFDHGVSMGPISGLSDISKILPDVSKGGANAAVLYRGSIPSRFWEEGGSMGLNVHL